MKKFIEGIQKFFLSERGQVVFGVLLIILVPSALVLNTIIAVSSARDNMNTELQLKSLLAHRIIQVTSKQAVKDPVQLATLIHEVQASDSEIWGIDVLAIRTDGKFSVVASTVESNVGRLIDAQSTTTAQGLVKPVLDLNLGIAWSQKQILAAVTSSPDRSTVEQSSGNKKQRDRFWVVTGPLFDIDGMPQALINIKISSAKVDQLASQAFTKSMFVLVASILIVMLLLFANNRLFQYAVLFRKLKEVDQMKDDFISIASHELRTPITGIRGYLSMILDGNMGTITPETKNALDLVNKSAERLNGLVEDLLNVSRLEQGRMDMELAPIAPKTVIDEVMAEVLALAKEKQLALAYEGADQLPNIEVNRDRFKQVMINLVGNAIKYTPKGKVTIIPEVKEKLLRIKVSDTGLGMSPTDMSRLFSKFYRIKTDQTQEIAGTGLGLWITKQIVEKMKGTIEVESIEGTGSQFIVSFPVTSANEAQHTLEK